MEELHQCLPAELEQVMNHYGTTVYRLAYAQTRSASDADDIYQEVFLRYFRKRPYPKQKHGQRGISNTLERLGKSSAVVAIPQTNFSKLRELVAEYVEHILFMYQLSYEKAETDTSRRVLGKGGLLHLIREDFEIEYLNLKSEGLPWSLSGISYNQNLDTVMEYGSSALLHLIVPLGTDPASVQYIIEYIYSHLGEDGELNFSVTVIPERRDSVGVDLLVADTVTETEASRWY